MKFTDLLLEDISREKEKNPFELILKKLKQADKIGIWGTGLAGSMIYGALQRLHIEVQFFADNDPQKTETYFLGTVVKDMMHIPPDALILIAANVKYGIHEQLRAVSAEYLYIDPVYLYFWDKNTDVAQILYENKQQIDDVYQMLTDDVSKKVYRNILLHRAVHNLTLVWEVYDEHQYFGNPIVKQAKGCFVDCGAFRGDTLISFLGQIGTSDYDYYALEADRDNYHVLKEYCVSHSLEKVHPINIGVWDRKEKISFVCDEAAGNVSGRIIENGEKEQAVEVMADSIDHILPDAEIDFIKMDIEGAEIRALQGARKSIGKNSPILAVSAYHYLEHLWQVPALIHDFNRDYEIHFGHHMWNMADTVCYGLIGGT